ncbi:signal peptidase II [Sulfitobacter sabulilitoris]|uniref:Lipoprotein signal peptidase n=1 Tax=Sulfitobacter sabulilitoris TaxID=2562655 RepID=A0A5S3PEG8_9RHOB|nr:signal peptidase II [Sulfitobacter sabulilitoris]TMM52349.1 signal peptidase II [Sulfitobacter sabulilitoris]
MKRVFWAALAAFVIDQITKYAVIHMMDLSRIRSFDVFPPLLTFRYGENRGMNFGLLSNGDDAGRVFLIAMAIVICTAVLVWVWRTPMRPLAQICAGLLVGGALANVADRLIYGYVLDFLNMSCCGVNNPFVFNVADVFIFGGALGMVMLTGEPKSPRAKPARKKGR